MLSTTQRFTWEHIKLNKKQQLSLIFTPWSFTLNEPKSTMTIQQMIWLKWSRILSKTRMNLMQISIYRLNIKMQIQFEFTIIYSPLLSIYPLDKAYNLFLSLRRSSCRLLYSSILFSRDWMVACNFSIFLIFINFHFNFKMLTFSIYMRITKQKMKLQFWQWNILRVEKYILDFRYLYNIYFKFNYQHFLSII